MTRFPERRRFPSLPRPFRFLLIDLAELNERQAFIVVAVLGAVTWCSVAVLLRGWFH